MLIVFDTELDSIWIEALNSLFDDNRMLSLPNGERLSLPSHVKFIFECWGLGNVSPATISRLGLISTEKQN